MSGILYGVGVGPGNPEMLTLQAIKVLEKADVIAVPDTSGEKTAMKIVKEYIEDKEIIYCPAPMSRDQAFLGRSRRVCCALLEKQLDLNKNVAFITLGAPTIYSTYMYIHRMIKEKGYATKIIPGITSFCASAAALETSLCDGGEPLHIVPASYEDTGRLLALKGNKILMKSGKNLSEVKSLLKDSELDREVQMVECCGMENEKIYKSLREIPESSSYFSIIIVKDA